MRRRPWIRGEEGQSLIELFFLLPIYVLLAILIVQFTATYFGIFSDLSEIRNEALEAGRKAEGVRVACIEKRNRHSFLMGMAGPTETYETRIRLYAYGNGPANCPG